MHIDAWRATHSSALRVTIGKTRTRFLGPSWPRRLNPCRAINFPSRSESSHQIPDCISQTMWIVEETFSNIKWPRAGHTNRRSWHPSRCSLSVLLHTAASRPFISVCCVVHRCCGMSESSGRTVPNTIIAHMLVVTACRCKIVGLLWSWALLSQHRATTGARRWPWQRHASGIRRHGPAGHVCGYMHAYAACAFRGNAHRCMARYT